MVREKDVVVTNVTAHSGYEELEPVGVPIPRQLVAEWKHVAVVLVAGVHNATTRPSDTACRSKATSFGQCTSKSKKPSQTVCCVTGKSGHPGADSGARTAL